MRSNSWDAKWDSVYATQGFRGKYPDEAVVRFIAGKFFRLEFAQRKKIRVLDLGCGPGRHVLFLAREGFSAYGIDASQEAIALCKKKLKEERLKARVRVADFISLPYADGYFDAVVDCASVQHNRVAGIEKIIEEVYRVTKKGGEFLSIVRTDQDYAYGKARQIEPGTFTDYTALDLNNVGHIHFFSGAELPRIFSRFQQMHYEYTERTIEDRTKSIRHWLVRSTK